MLFKTLLLEENFKENILIDRNSLSLVISTEYLDDYFHREWDYHWHDEFEFGLVLQGCVEYTIYNEYEQLSTEKLSAGEGIFINIGCFHSVKGLVPDTIMAVIVMPATFFDVKPFNNVYHQNIYTILNSSIEYFIFDSNNLKSKTILSSIKELYEISDNEKTYELHCIELVCKIWRLLIENFSNDKRLMIPSQKSIQFKRLQKIITFIHSHYSEHINIEDMAKAAMISRTEVFRCFNSILKKKPNEYLIEYRLSVATILLTNTNKTLSDISILCGFNSVSYFGKVFREYHGISPKKYKEKIKNK